MSFSSFAKPVKQTLVVTQKVDKTELFNNGALNEDNSTDVKYVFADATCHADVYYYGKLVKTLRAVGSGDSSFDAQLDCLAAANRMAQEYIRMMDKYLSEN